MRHGRKRTDTAGREVCERGAAAAQDDHSDAAARARPAFYSLEARGARAVQLAVAVGGVEPHAAGGKRVEIRRFHDRMALGAGELRRHVVGHDQYDVGLGRSG